MIARARRVPDAARLGTRQKPQALSRTVSQTSHQENKISTFSKSAEKIPKVTKSSINGSKITNIDLFLLFSGVFEYGRLAPKIFFDPIVGGWKMNLNDPFPATFQGGFVVFHELWWPLLSYILSTRSWKYLESFLGLK